MSKLVYFTGDIALVDNLGIEECMAIQEPLKKLHEYEIAEEKRMLIMGDSIREIAKTERNKAIDEAMEKVAKTICVGCGYLDALKCTYKGGNCGVSKPIFEEVIEALEQMKRGMSMPVLWKYDNDLGIAYFCPHCKTFQCTGNGSCTVCGENIDWSKKQRYDGKVRYERF